MCIINYLLALSFLSLYKHDLKIMTDIVDGCLFLLNLAVFPAVPGRIKLTKLPLRSAEVLWYKHDIKKICDTRDHIVCLYVNDYVYIILQCLYHYFPITFLPG
jgi:hypothetical protein